MNITDKITITNEDNMVLMARYPDNYFDLAIVDPPYGIGMGGGKIGNSKKDYKQFAGEDNSIPQKEYFEELKEVQANSAIAIVKSCGCINEIEVKLKDEDKE